MNRLVNNHEAGDLRRHHAHYVVIVMTFYEFIVIFLSHSAYLYNNGAFIKRIDINMRFI